MSASSRARTSALRLVSCVFVASERERPALARRSIRAMETLDGVVERMVGPAADLVARRQRHVDVERRVFDALRRRRSAQLLEALHEGEAPRDRDPLSRAEQDVGDELQRRLQRRRAVRHRIGRRGLDVGAIRVVDRRAPSTYVR